MSNKTTKSKGTTPPAKYLAGLLEHVNDAIISMDLDLMILSWNKAAERLYGWTSDEAIGNRIIDLLESEYPNDSRDQLIGTLRGTGQYEGQLIHHHKDGTPITVLTSGSVLTDGDENVVGYVSINRDVTDRQQAEDALRWWAHAFEHLEWGVVIGGDNNTLAMMNPAFARMHGYTVEELTGRPILEVFAPEVRSVVPDHIAAAHEKGFHTFESIHVRKDGSCFPVRINLTAVKDKVGNILYRAASVFDITGERRSDEALRESESRYRHMFESASVAMIEGDVSKLKKKFDELREGGVSDLREYLIENPEFIIKTIGEVSLTDINQKAIELFEAHDADELRRALPSVFLPETYERYREMLVAFAEDRDHFETETVVTTLNGNRRHIFLLATFPREGAPFDNPLVSIFDVTARKETEEALLKTQFAIDRAADALLWIQPDGRIVEVNDAACRLLGYPRGELLSMCIDQIDPMERDWDSAWSELASKGSITMESNHVTKEGRLIPVEVVSNYLDYRGKEYICAFVRDITERKELESQLLQSQKLETIGTLAGGIAHDFNNILGPILGYTDMLLADQPEGSPMTADLEHIMRAANRAKDLVRQILLFSRGGVHDRKPVLIQLIVNEALKLLEATLPPTIEIRRQIDPDCGAVLADPSQVHQVLLNLCTNAQHAMRDKVGKLTVSLSEFEADGDFVRTLAGMKPGRYVKMTVSDTGHGIDAASIERIFEPFFSTKHVGEGTGLGLSVAHGIVVRHGGAITVDSTLGRGTTFHVYLPRAEREESPVDVDVLQRASCEESVLYVEDRDEVASVGRTMMERLGYNVTVALTGMDALELFRANPDRFDVVVTDQTMPGMTGAELASELLEIRPELPIVLMTGYSEAITADSARRMGIRGFLRKPIVTRELAVTLRQAIDPLPTPQD
jgi:PAS domain S-box-containing protein